MPSPPTTHQRASAGARRRSVAQKLLIVRRRAFGRRRTAPRYNSGSCPGRSARKRSVLPVREDERRRTTSARRRGGGLPGLQALKRHALADQTRRPGPRVADAVAPLRRPGSRFRVTSTRKRSMQLALRQALADLSKVWISTWPESVSETVRASAPCCASAGSPRRTAKHSASGPSARASHTIPSSRWSTPGWSIRGGSGACRVMDSVFSGHQGPDHRAGPG
jgi:hypothetical protein